MSTEPIKLGAELTVTGEIQPFAFEDKSTGEMIGTVKLRIPGDEIGVMLDPKHVERMKEGQIWRVTGLLLHRKKSGKLSISRPTRFVLLQDISHAESEPEVVFETATARAPAKA